MSSSVSSPSAAPVVLGTIIGKSTTREFTFEIQSETKVFEYLRVHHRAFGDVLCQVAEITTTLDDSVAVCTIIGYRDPDGAIKAIRIPFDVGSRVERADDAFIRSIIKLGDEHGALLGKLEGREVPLSLDLRKLLTKHVCVLAKSGAGKSYAVGVLIEEILEKNVPVIIIDPHGEYATLSEPSAEVADYERLNWYNRQAKGYKITEYGDPQLTNGIPLKLSNRMSQQELVQMIPAKLTGTQIGILYSALRNIDHVSLDSVIQSLGAEESNAKWGLINILEHLRNYNIFASDPTPYEELISPGVCSVINLRGIPAEIQSIIVFKLTKDLFELRKRGELPPFFLVIEEAHNFCPERSFGETTASKTIRTIASEGRKFGLGLCVISQRPARLDKSVVSQCTTQIILKVTNPNDLKAIGASVEGLTAESEREIANLPVGTALVTGIVEVPLVVNVRPRRTLHGGRSVDILDEIAKGPKRRAPRASPKPAAPHAAEAHSQNVPSRQAQPQDAPSAATLSKPSPTTVQKRVVRNPAMSTPTGKLAPAPSTPITILRAPGHVVQPNVTYLLRPAYLVSCQQGTENFTLAIERTSGMIVTNLEMLDMKRLPNLKELSKPELGLLQQAYTKGTLALKDAMPSAAKGLAEKGYVTVQGDTLQLSSAYIFQKLSKVRIEQPLEFIAIPNAMQQEPTVNEMQARMALSPFVAVKSTQECWLLQTS
jgi:DNA helicase HerA-like ATPase